MSEDRFASEGNQWCLGGVRRKSSGGAEDHPTAFVMSGHVREWISYVSGSGDRTISPEGLGAGTKYARNRGIIASFWLDLEEVSGD